MRAVRSRTTWACLSLGIATVLGCFAACSSGSDHPKPSADPDAQVGETGTVGEGGIDGGDVPPSCRNTMKEGSETDIDCGGDICNACPIGKACIQDKDCLGGAQCTNKICALCKNNKTDGDETDVDCGGTACGPCTVGKRCKVALDCKSEACTNDACACPKDMTIIPLAGGGAYCVDSEEVSKGQYNRFLTANVPVGDQADSCLTANTTFVPRGAWPPAAVPGPLEFNLGLPVHYVDWCDATAYCKWAKKELCGTIGGGPVAQTDALNPAKSAWFNACSAQGTKTYPYGAVPYAEGACNGNGRAFDGDASTGVGPGAGGDRSGNFGYPFNQDDQIYDVVVSDAIGNITSNTHVGCQGGTVGLYQMSGNLAEWENACDGAAATANCSVRGGSYAANDDPASLSCAAVRTVVRMPATPDPLKDIGIRCCQY